MIKKVAIILIALNINSFANDNEAKTVLIHSEIATHKNPNITVETHPALYTLVKELVDKAGIGMPKYISTFNREYLENTSNGLYSTQATIQAYVDVFGDIHICKEILTDLSYPEIEGIIATAIAEKISNKPVKQAFTAVTTLGAVLASLYILNKIYDLKIGTFLYNFIQPSHCSHDQADAIQMLVGIMAIPPVIAMSLVSNSLQKQIDVKATTLTNTENVIKGIAGIKKLQKAYAKNNFFTRIAATLKLKKIMNVITYPVRASTPKERIGYLKTEAQPLAVIA